MQSACSECASPLPVSDPSRGGRRRIYCSSRCAMRAYNRRHGLLQETRESRCCARPACDEMLPTGAHGLRRYCSRACNARDGYERNGRAGHLKPRVELTCRYCKSVYEVAASRAATSQRCASNDCRKAHNARLQRERGYTRKSRAKLGRPASTIQAAERRRVRLAGGEVEVFTRAEIFKRDSWTCGLCFGPVDPALTWPDPASASIDHIVPVSRGGGHTRENVQCAHVGCNSRKGADRAGSSSQATSSADQPAA